MDEGRGGGGASRRGSGGLGSTNIRRRCWVGGGVCGGKRDEGVRGEGEGGYGGRAIVGRGTRRSPQRRTAEGGVDPVSEVQLAELGEIPVVVVVSREETWQREETVFRGGGVHASPVSGKQ